MDFQQLKYFKAVATMGKITDAADSLFISAPALSTSISRLEKELGVRLFDRAGNRITLNSQGEIFLKHVNHILSNMESAKQEMQQSLEQATPSISVVSINSLMWVNLITAFTAEFPQYMMAYSSTSNLRLSENGLPPQCNLLLAYENEIPLSFDDEMDSVTLFRTKPVVMLHKDHPLAQESEIEISMLANEKLLLSQPDDILHTRLVQLFELRGLTCPPFAYYSYLIRRQMVSKNLGISFSTQSISHVFSPDIRYIPLVDPFDPWAARLYWRKGHPLTEHEATFKAFAETFFGDLH